jgi:hypothetical protein
MPDQMVNVPLEHFNRLVAAPLELAKAEAGELLRRGDTAGANARIAQGIEQSASLRTQALAQQHAAPPAAAPLAAPGTPAPHPVPAPRNVSEAMIREHRERQAARTPGGDPRMDMSVPFGMRPSRRIFR